MRSLTARKLICWKFLIVSLGLCTVLLPIRYFQHYPQLVQDVEAETSIPEPYIVKLKDKNQKEEFKKKVKDQVKGKRAVQVTSLKAKEDIVKTRLTKQDVQALQKDRTVSYIEKDRPRKIEALPNDESYSNQWSLAKIGLSYKNPATVPPESATSGWDITTGASSTIIAVVDTGIDLNHPDLIPNLWKNLGEISGDSVDNDNNGYVDDSNGWNFADGNNDVSDVQGHGTHVSGIIAAATNNSTGIAGTCWSCKIMPLKVINAQGYGYDSDIADAILYAISKGAKVINMSLGGEGYSQTLQNAVNTAWNNNVLVLAASGNGGGSGETASDSYPSGLIHAISVGASDSNDVIPLFSNKGSKLDAVAPGVNIYSTWCISSSPPSSGPCTPSSYAFNSGTSMAAPYASGVAALIRTANPSLSVNEVRYDLLNNIDDLSPAGFDQTSGFGRINALKALRPVNTLGSDSVSPVGSLTQPNPSIVNGTIAINGTASDANLYLYTLNFASTNDGYIKKQVSGRNSVTSGVLATIDTTAIPDGTYNVSMTVEDFNGNSITSNSINVDIENASPAPFSTIYPENGRWQNTARPNFTWESSSDSQGAVLYTLVIDAINYCTDITDLNCSPTRDLAEGDHSWFVRAKNTLNNLKDSNTAQVRIDLSPPNDFLVGVILKGSNATFQFAASDTRSGINRYEISLDQGSFTTVNSPYTISNLNEGNHTVTVNAIDNAGNIKSSTNTFTINSRNYFLLTKADFNLNGKVDLTDLSILAQNWQKNSNTGDANGDGKVNLSDLSILASNWQKSF